MRKKHRARERRLYPSDREHHASFCKWHTRELMPRGLTCEEARERRSEPSDRVPERSREYVAISCRARMCVGIASRRDHEDIRLQARVFGLDVEPIALSTNRSHSV